MSTGLVQVGTQAECWRTCIFFHPDYTVGFGVSPNHAMKTAFPFSSLAGFTAGGELHPALKIIFDINIVNKYSFVNRAWQDFVMRYCASLFACSLFQIGNPRLCSYRDSTAGLLCNSHLDPARLTRIENILGYPCGKAFAKSPFLPERP